RQQLLLESVGNESDPRHKEKRRRSQELQESGIEIHPALVSIPGATGSGDVHLPASLTGIGNLLLQLHNIVRKHGQSVQQQQGAIPPVETFQVQAKFMRRVIAAYIAVRIC